MRPRGRRDASLMQVAAAIVGSASAARVVAPIRTYPHAHDWQERLKSRGKNAGQPMSQRQCGKCEIWETDYSVSAGCQIADPEPALNAVGSATQVVTPVPEIVQRDHRRGACWCGTRHSLTDLPLPAAAHAEGLDVHAALNTYEARPGELEGATEEPDTLSVVGANGRRLVARWTPDGVWIGGCLITDEAVADRLAAFITREDESQ